MFKIRRLFLGKGKKERKELLVDKMSKSEEREGTSTCGQNV